MKRLLAWAMIALPLLAACDGDKVGNEENNGGGGSGDVTLSKLAGEWYLNVPDLYESLEVSLIINTDGSFVNESVYSYDNNGIKVIVSQHRVEGKYKLEGSLLIGKVNKAQYKTSGSDWQDEQYEAVDDTAKVSFLRNESVLLIQSLSPDERDASFYFKKGTSLPNNKSELQGTWYSMETRDEKEAPICVAVKFDGDSIDLIVVPWSQRFICKYKYEDGIVSSDGEVTFRTLWHENGANELNEEDPFASEWLPTYDPEQYTGNLTDGFSFPFIVDGNTGYCIFVGPSIIYNKQ